MKVIFPKCLHVRILSFSYKCSLIYYIIDWKFHTLTFKTYSRRIKFHLVNTMYMWINIASIAFMGDLVPPTKRKLALYPVCLFYIFLSWFVLIIWNFIYFMYDYNTYMNLKNEKAINYEFKYKKSKYWSSYIFVSK